MPEILAEIRDLKVHFPVRSRSILRGEAQVVRAVDGVSLRLARGQVLGLVGESGSGKSTIGRALLRLAPITSGQISFGGSDITHLNTKQLLPFRRQMQIVFQDPDASLNPRMRAGDCVAEPLQVHFKLSPKQIEQKVCELFEQMGLAPELRQRYPHEFSGGQRQRIGLARALATDPQLLVLDEPISALDVSIQAQVLNLLSDLRTQRNLTYLFIAHDLAAVAHLSDVVAVLYLGKIVEMGPAEQVLTDPQHPYTQALLASVPLADPVLARQRGLAVLSGEIPSPLNPPTGCAFHPRCARAVDECKGTTPALRSLANAPQVQAACLRLATVALDSAV